MCSTLSSLGLREQLYRKCKNKMESLFYRSSHHGHNTDDNFRNERRNWILVCHLSWHCRRCCRNKLLSPGESSSQDTGAYVYIPNKKCETILPLQPFGRRAQFVGSQISISEVPWVHPSVQNNFSKYILVYTQTCRLFSTLHADRKVFYVPRLCSSGE